MNNISSNLHCGGPYSSTEVAIDTCFENKPPTLEEMALHKYLEEHPSIIENKDILHVGTGDGSLVQQLSRTAHHVDSISISRSEIELAKRKYSNTNTDYYLINKHNKQELDSLKDTYDIIIDVNLKSFACCETHFIEMLEKFLSMMHESSCIFSALSGVNYGWNGNTKLAYTPGAETSVLANNFRILGIKGLREICNKYNLKYERIPIRNIQHFHGIKSRLVTRPLTSDEQIIVIQKIL